MDWTIQPIEQLEAISSQWDELNAHSGNMPFLDSTVLRRALQHFGRGKELLALCRNDDRLLAAAVVEPTGLGAWQTFQPGQIPIGAWLHRKECDLDLLMAHALRALPGFALLLGVTQQDPELVARPPESTTLETVDYIETARITVKSTFTDYWHARGSNLKQNLKKQRNRLTREGVQLRLECIGHPAQVAAAVDDYGRLESQGWKGQEGTAIHPDNAQGRFYREMFRYLAERGEALIYRYFFNDRLAASDLCVYRDGVVVVLKTAFDPSDKSLSPSLLLKQTAYEQLFSGGGIRRIEFYGRVMEWHRRWSDEIRMMYHVNKLRWGWVNLLRGRQRSPRMQSAPATST